MNHRRWASLPVACLLACFAFQANAEDERRQIEEVIVTAEKVEATGFSGRPLQPLTRVLQEAARSNQLPIIFSLPDFSIQSILILTLKHVNCISFSVVT